jgi:hypothetical protein
MERRREVDDLDRAVEDGGGEAGEIGHVLPFEVRFSVTDGDASGV